MNSRTLGELDNYITNPRYFKVATEEECENCGCRWEARVEGEYGRTYFVDEDGFCPECGVQVPD